MILLKRKYNREDKTKNSFAFVIISVCVLLFSSCESMDETAEVSHLSYKPEFEIIGGEFQSTIVVDSAEYEDKGATATANGEPLEVYSYGEEDVDLTEVGVYTVTYFAENSDGISATAERIVAVTNVDVTENDLSGKYIGTRWSPLVEMKVSKLHAKGYYKCEDIMGIEGSDMPGNIVDLGNHELYLVHGEGDFGRYAASEGSYTLSAIDWTLALLDEPYTGYETFLSWSRVED